MENKDKTSCKHEYIVGYSIRMPNVFFRSLPCDHCGCRIQLTLPWRLFFTFTEVIGFIAAFIIAWSVHIRIYGTTFIVSLLIFLFLTWIVELIGRIILKHGKWIEVDQKQYTK